jgi:glucose/arabinose dehydrogenase
MRRSAAALVALGLVLAGCGRDAPDRPVAPTAVNTTAATTTTIPGTTTAPTSPGSSAAATTTSPPAPAGPALDGLQVTLTKVASLSEPVDVLTRPGDATGLYVVERGGRVRVVRDGAVAADPVLDISDRTRAGGERGLLGAAFSPDGAWLYVDYTDLSGNSHVESYAVGATGIADPASRRELLFQEQPYPNHNGGDLVFGPDKMLYITFGDGGSGGDPQRHADKLDTWLGKILRVDPTPTGPAPYVVPPDNPFVGRAGARPEIWSYGLRNPWRISFDRGTGDLWIGDVGQDRIEEIDRSTVAEGAGRGVNFGWSAFEGTSRYNDDVAPDGAVPPVYEYRHGSLGCSVTGGSVYRGAAVPALRGAYVFADYCGKGLRAIDPANPATAVTIAPDATTIVSFGEGADGELYAASLDGGVYRIDPDRGA